MKDKNVIPEGYWKDANGHLVHESMIKPIDRERDTLVRQIAAGAVGLNSELKEFKARCFGDIQAFIDLSIEQYDVRPGGKKGNVTLFSFDGQYKIQRQVAENIAFDERLQAARALIDECLQEWTEHATPELKIIVEKAFAEDKEGNISAGRVLALRRYEITDPRWLRAMEAIGESVQVINSTSYIRVYQRVGDTGKYQPITLDMAGV